MKEVSDTSFMLTCSDGVLDTSSISPSLHDAGYEVEQYTVGHLTEYCFTVSTGSRHSEHTS